MERYVIHVTKACNMKCVYCYENDKTSTYTWSEIKQLCIDIINNNTNKQDYSIEFLGGEPVLAFDYIKKSVELFNTQDPEHCKYFIITTNGTILNNDIINFLLNHENIIWSSSIDGRDSSNYLRIFKDKQENSYNIATYNLKKLLLSGIDQNRLSIHMVTHPLNVSMIYDNIVDFYNMGIRNISVGTIEHAMKLTEEYANTFLNQMYLVAKDIVSGKLSGLFIDIFNIENIERTLHRFYIKNSYGKTIGETYGQNPNDILSANIYNSYEGISSSAKFIYDLREKACGTYMELLDEKNNK